MEFLADPQVWISLLTLTALEIVLGIDNIIFISILAGKLPKEQQAKARQLGLSLALVTRLLLLAGIAWIAKLTTPLFTVFDFSISGRDLILLIGGLFLIAKSTFEIHEKLEGEESHGTPKAAASFTSVIIQILLLDIVFSLDSVITAVGMASQLWIMITAVIIAMGVMLMFAGAISDFVHKHPTLKMLALSFLILIGVSLMAEGLHQHIPKGYIYFSMAFSCAVEFINLKLRSKASKPVVLRESIKQ
ncbi:MAG TPA: TerC family protein [Opitutaceae bacterium]|jgi:predicted tellurium resistance membrane protein TerC|nr:TerC family protein [Opitutaceae bacterium]HRE07748.1 TerC family protein [Opitutaceae bacterium]